MHQRLIEVRRGSDVVWRANVTSDELRRIRPRAEKHGLVVAVLFVDQGVEALSEWLDALDA